MCIIDSIEKQTTQGPFHHKLYLYVMHGIQGHAVDDRLYILEYNFVVIGAISNSVPAPDGSQSTV